MSVKGGTRSGVEKLNDRRGQSYRWLNWKASCPLCLCSRSPDEMPSSQRQVMRFSLHSLSLVLSSQLDSPCGHGCLVHPYSKPSSITGLHGDTSGFKGGGCYFGLCFILCVVCHDCVSQVAFVSFTRDQRPWVLVKFYNKKIVVFPPYILQYKCE